MNIQLSKDESEDMHKFVLEAARTYLWMKKSMQLPEDAIKSASRRYDGRYEICIDDKNIKYDSFNKKWMKLTETGWEEFEGS